jgi:sec-independent protein translocase protein TatC
MSTTPENHEPNKEQLAEGTLMSHLLELRTRLMKAMLAVSGVFLCLVPFTQRVFETVSAPLIAVLPEGSEMIATDVTSPFMTPLKTTFFVAIFIAMPVVLFQVWQFIAPGLYKHEKRFAVPLMVSSILLFYAGIAFAYFVVFGVMFSFFAQVVPGGVAMTPDISSYLSFVLGIFLAFGLAFEVPIATVMLIWSRLVSIKTLKSIRPYVFLGAFVAGMLLAPDVFSMTLMAIPMYLLYECGLIMARFMLPEKTAPTEDAAS